MVLSSVLKSPQDCSLLVRYDYIVVFILFESSFSFSLWGVSSVYVTKYELVDQYDLFVLIHNYLQVKCVNLREILLS